MPALDGSPTVVLRFAWERRGGALEGMLELPESIVLRVADSRTRFAGATPDASGDLGLAAGTRRFTHAIRGA